MHLIWLFTQAGQWGALSPFLNGKLRPWRKSVAFQEIDLKQATQGTSSTIFSLPLSLSLHCSLDFTQTRSEKHTANFFQLLNSYQLQATASHCGIDCFSVHSVRVQSSLGERHWSVTCPWQHTSVLPYFILVMTKHLFIDRPLAYFIYSIPDL